MPLKIEMEDWMCHRHGALEVAGAVALIVGANGTGKTALRDALEFVYLGTGHLRGIGTKKELGQLSVREGADRCSVRIETDRMGVWREMKRDGSQKLFRVERSSATEHWSEPEQIPMRKDGRSEIGNVAADALRAMIEPTGFYQLPSERRREILIASTSEGGNTEAECLEALRGHLEPEFPEDLAALEQAAKWVADEGFRHAEEQAGEARRRAKRDLADLPEAPAKPEGLAPEVEQGFAENTLEAYQERLQALRDQHTAAVASEASSASAIEGRLAEAQKAQSAAENAEYENRDAEAAPVLKATLTALEDAGKALESANRDVESAAAEVTRLDQPEPDFEKPTTCPAAPWEMKCPVKLETFEKRRPAQGGNRKAALGEARALEKTALQTQQDAAGAVEAAREQSAHAETRARAEQARQGREDACLEAIQTSRARTQEIEGELLEARKAAESGQGKSVAELAEQITLGERLTRQKADYDLHHAAMESRTAREGDLKLAIERWNALALELKPGGIETSMGGGARQRFLELLDEAEGLAGTIELSQDFEIAVTRDGATRHPLQLSTSQRLGVGIAIQNALCRLVEFPILCCDEVDLFDGAQRAAWSEFAKHASEGYLGAVFGLATLTDPDGARAAAGIETFRLTEKGALERLQE